jgi:hypothetical protein
MEELYPQIAPLFADGRTNRKGQFDVADFAVGVESVPDIVKPKIAKSATRVLILALIGLQWCSQAWAQVILQDGSPTSITNNVDATSISRSFAVTSGADALVVSLYDQNDVPEDSGPAAMAWGTQPMVKAGGQFDPRGVYP